MSKNTVAPQFQFKNGILHAEDLALTDLAQAYGTPLSIYSRRALQEALHSYTSAAQGRAMLICYAIKANSNLAVLPEFARLAAGLDVVPRGELARVIAAGGKPPNAVFSGAGSPTLRA